MTATRKLMSSVLKGYLYQNAARDARKLIRRAQKIDYEKLMRQLELRKLLMAAKNIDLDRESLLHRVGLTDYRPGKALIGGIALFSVGVITGGVAALAMAPKPGEALRTELKDRAMSLFGKAEERAGQMAHGAPMA